MKLCPHVDFASMCPLDKPMCLPEVSCPLAVAAAASDKALVALDELALSMAGVAQRLSALETALCRRARLRAKAGRAQVVPLRSE